MNQLMRNYAAELNECVPPCLSIFMPTHRHHPDNQQDPLRFANLVKSLQKSLVQQLSMDETKTLLKSFYELEADSRFWNHTLDGLAVFGAKGLFRAYKLQRSVNALAIVADSFHTKPLMRILQSADRFQVLALNLKEIRLFEGNRDALDEIELANGVPKTIAEALGEELTEPHQTVASYGGVGGEQSPMHHGHGGKKSEIDKDAERFFRAVDRAILDHHSKPSGLPLILASLPQHHSTFHKVSDNSFLVQESIDVHPDALSSIDKLRERAWQIIEPRYLARMSDLVEEFGTAKANGLGQDDLLQVAKAVVAGRVATLLIEADREIPGRVDAANGEIQMGNLTHPEIDDVLDDLGTLTLKMGGNVVVVPAERMPTQSGTAAIYRF